MTKQIKQEREVFESDGILIGWYCESGSLGQVFIPRRDEDVDQDRAEIAALIRRAQR